MRQALRCGVSIEGFWNMTPVETFATIEAVLWREEANQRREITQAWLTAALGRAKRLPKLERLLVKKPKRLTGVELERRKKEFDDMANSLDIEVLNKSRSKHE